MGEIEKVPLAAYEAQAERDHKTFRFLIIGWLVTCALLAFVVCMMISYDEETITDTISTNSIDQDGGDYGSNVYAGGDYYGSADNPDGNKDANGSQEKARD